MLVDSDSESSLKTKSTDFNIEVGIFIIHVYHISSFLHKLFVWCDYWPFSASGTRTHALETQVWRPNHSAMSSFQTIHRSSQIGQTETAAIAMTTLQRNCSNMDIDDDSSVSCERERLLQRMNQPESIMIVGHGNRVIRYRCETYIQMVSVCFLYTC